MTATITATRVEHCIALMREMSPEMDVAFITSFLEGKTDAEVEAMIDAAQSSIDEKIALRARVMGDAALRSVICPASDWKDADARYSVTRGCLRLVEAYAARNEVTVEALVEALVATEGGIARSIETHQEDPRLNSFYAYKWRIQDALAHLKADEKRAAWNAEVARQEARGHKVCTRCGGAGGSHAWPGFTCFECEGRKFLPIAR